MHQILVRDLEAETVELLKETARRNGRSLQAEVKQILEEAAARATRRRGLAEFLRFADEMAEASGPQSTDSVDMIREDRDS